MSSIGTEPVWDPASDAAVTASFSQPGLPLALAKLLACFAVFLRNQVHSGSKVSDPTTPSTQATGATGATVLNVNLAAIDATVGGVRYEAVADEDLALHDTTVYTADTDESTLTNGKESICTVLLKEVDGTVSVATVKGACVTSATASAVAPTDTEICTALSTMNWIKLGDVLVTRDGDTSVTQAQTDRRPVWMENCFSFLDSLSASWQPLIA